MSVLARVVPQAAALVLVTVAACAPRTPAATAGVRPTIATKRSTAMPTTAPNPSATPALSDPAALSIEQRLAAFLPAAAAHLEQPLQSPQAVSAEEIMREDLEALMRQYALQPVYLQRAQGVHEAWVGAASVETKDARQAVPFLLWRQGDKVSYRSLIGEDELLQWFINPPRGMRVVEADGMLEMGLITFNWGSGKDVWFMLLRLEEGRWHIVWSPKLAGGAYGIGGPSIVEYVDDGIDAFRVAGPLPSDVQAARVFDESGPFLKQIYESEWQRQGDRYVRVSGRLLPSALTSLANLIERLQQGDRTGATAWATGAAVIDAALQLGLDQPAAGNGWMAEQQSKSVDKGESILFYDGVRAPRGFVATIIKQGDGWRVQGIQKVGLEG